MSIHQWKNNYQDKANILLKDLSFKKSWLSWRWCPYRISRRWRPLTSRLPLPEEETSHESHEGEANSTAGNAVTIPRLGRYWETRGPPAPTAVTPVLRAPNACGEIQSFLQRGEPGIKGTTAHTQTLIRSRSTLSKGKAAPPKRRPHRGHLQTSGGWFRRHDTQPGGPTDCQALPYNNVTTGDSPSPYKGRTCPGAKAGRREANLIPGHPAPARTETGTAVTGEGPLPRAGIFPDLPASASPTFGFEAQLPTIFWALSWLLWQLDTDKESALSRETRSPNTNKGCPTRVSTLASRWTAERASQSPRLTVPLWVQTTRCCAWEGADRTGNNCHAQWACRKQLSLEMAANWTAEGLSQDLIESRHWEKAE